jgi:hypothetical protein
MFERFTEQARRVLVLATREARAAGHPNVDSGDLLVALAEESEGVASHALAEAGAALDDVATANRELPTRTVVAVDEAMAEDAKTALQVAAEQAVSLDRAEVDTGHLLLGLLDQDGCRALDLLAALSVDRDQLADAVVRIGREGGRDGAPARTIGHPTRSRVLSTLLDQWEPALEGPATERVALLRTRVEATDDLSDLRRQWALADWLVRLATPAWLDAAGLGKDAAALRAVGSLDGRASAESAGAVLDAVAAELAERVPAAIPSPVRPAVAAELDGCRAAGGERAAGAAVTDGLDDNVTDAATDGVRRAVADLVMRQAHDPALGPWGRAFSNARKEAEASTGRRSGTARPSGQGARRVAMRAVRMAAGPAALPLTILEAGVRSARERRARDRLDQAAARAALVACCRQVIDDAQWLVAGSAATAAGANVVAAVADATRTVSAVQQRSLMDLLERLSANPGVETASPDAVV